VVPGGREYRIGVDYERLLRKKLSRLGFVCVRAPASGKARGRLVYPDIVCVKEGKALFIEVKYRGDKRDIYIEKPSFHSLRYLAAKAECRILLCVFYRDLGKFLCLDLMRPDLITEKYAVFRRESFLERGIELEEVRP